MAGCKHGIGRFGTELHGQRFFGGKVFVCLCVKIKNQRVVRKMNIKGDRHSVIA